MKKKMRSLFTHEEEEKEIHLKNPKHDELDLLNAEEREKLDEYPSPRQSTPENRDISPY
jgi:hypothetical protein